MMKQLKWKRKRGNIGDLMTTGMCMLGMMIVMLAYFDSVELLNQKENVGQLARKYILRMETVGYLTPEDRIQLTVELESAGVTEIDYEGTTLQETAYGSPITLQIAGRLKGEHDFVEKRASTAKN